MDIPAYPDGRELELADKVLLDALFMRLQPRISEFTFADLFLFRKAHSYRLSMVGDSLVVLGKGYDGAEYFLPPLGGDVRNALAVVLEEGRLLYGADEVFVREYLRDAKGVEI